MLVDFITDRFQEEMKTTRELTSEMLKRLPSFETVLSLEKVTGTRNGSGSGKEKVS